MEEPALSTPLEWCLALRLALLRLRFARQPPPQLKPPVFRCRLRPWFRDTRGSSLVGEKKKVYIEDCMKIIIVCLFVRAVTANESV